MSKKKKTIIITISSILGIITLLVGTFFIYVSIYAHAEKERISNYLANKDVTITEVGNKTLKISGEEEKAGIIFYPGGKVEYIAYEPLLVSLATKGYTSFLIHMPFNLAIFDPNRANGYINDYPEIKTWYLMGHSLGGAMISEYASSHADDYSGLVLLGAYPNKDLSRTSLKLLSIYGSNDKVLNINKYNDKKSFWPSNNKEYVIEGGCHAGFGMYGVQKGDGEPTITSEEQIDIASSAITSFIG